MAQSSKRSRSSNGGSTTVNTSPAKRVVEISGECFDIGKLLCTACKIDLSLKRSIVRDHVSSMRHKKGKQEMQKQGTTRG